MPRAQWDYLENYEVALPPLPEQRKIAEILGSIDDKIELNYEMNKTLEAIAQAIFKNWFVDFEPFKDELVYNEELGKEIPRGWEVAKIGEVAKIESGGNAPQGEEYFINGVYPFVRVKHLTDSPVVGGSDLINKKAIEDYRLRLFKKGSIIFAKSGEAIKAERINILPFDAFIVNHLAIISKATVSLWFIYFYMRELIHKLVIEQGGTALPYLRISDIEREILLKPPSSVIEVFHSLTDPIFQNILLNYQENRTLEKIRDSLLPKLLSGEIRVKADVEREFPEETKKLEEIEEEKVKLQKSLEGWLK
jgi:type I restriction enzyme S subunit